MQVGFTGIFARRPPTAPSSIPNEAHAKNASKRRSIKLSADGTFTQPYSMARRTCLGIDSGVRDFRREAGAWSMVNSNQNKQFVPVDGIVPSYSFEEGTKLGGSIIYKETSTDLKKRQKRYTQRMIFWTIGLILFLVFITIYYLSNRYSNLINIIVGCSFVVICCNLLIILLDINIKINMSPIRIYSSGFSLGIGKKPFYKFSDVKNIREEKDSRTGELLTIIAFINNREEKISNDVTRNVGLITQKYSEVRDSLMKQYKSYSEK